MAHDAHGLAYRETNHRFAGAPNQPLQRAAEIAPRVVGEVDQAPGQHQAPGRGIDEHRIAAAKVLLPVRFAELVADQLVRGRAVRHAQQRLGDAHQQHAFLAGKVVLTHERFDRALLAGARAHLRDQVDRLLDNGLTLRCGQARLCEQFVDRFRLVARPRRGDRCPLRRRRAGEIGNQTFAQGAVSMGGSWPWVGNRAARRASVVRRIAAAKRRRPTSVPDVCGTASSVAAPQRSCCWRDGAPSTMIHASNDRRESAFRWIRVACRCDDDAANRTIRTG